VTSDLLPVFSATPTPGGVPMTPGGPITPTPGGFTPGSVTPGGRGSIPIETRTPLRNRQQILISEAQNLKNLTEATTPLIGGENVALHPSDFSGATPRPVELRTPVSSRIHDDVAREERGYNEKDLRKKIAIGLSSLPAARPFKASMPDDMDFQMDDNQIENGTSMSIPDSHDLYKASLSREELEELEIYNSRSEVLKYVLI
jgi:hypothetical protein